MEVDVGLFISRYLVVVDIANAGARSVTNTAPTPANPAAATERLVTELLTTRAPDGPGLPSGDVKVVARVDGSGIMETTTKVVYHKVFFASPIPGTVSSTNWYRVVP